MALPQMDGRRYTYADYLKWDDDVRYELIDGVPHAMASPSPVHQSISMELSGQLWSHLRGKTCKVFTTLDIRLNADSHDNTIVQPDIIVACDKTKIKNNNHEGAPDLIIEILSPSTSKRDKLVKRTLYQSVGVREFWIVDPVDKIVEVNLLMDDKYCITVYDETETLPVHVLEGCEVSLTDVFQEI